MSPVPHPDPTRFKPLTDLQEWRDNYNHGDVAAIARSIRRFGMNAALRVWQDDVVMAGNHTLQALRLIQQEGWKPELDHAFPPTNIVEYDGAWYVPFIDMSHLDAVEARAFAIADNHLARQAVVDEEKLARYLQEAAAQDAAMLDATGFNQTQLDRMVERFLQNLGGPEDPGAADPGEALREQWGIETGQLWTIPSTTGQGDHRLLVGDSTKTDDVAQLMDGQRAALFATDPPYLVGYDGTNHPQAFDQPDKNKDWGESYHDWDDPAQGEALYEGFVSTAQAVAVAEDAAWYCWHASRHQAMLEDVWKRHGLFVHQQIIWVKDRPVLTRSWYMWQHEPCLFGWVQGKKPKRIAENYPSSVWSVPTIAPGTETSHPTSKPVELFTTPILQHTKHNEICYEAFAGSGTQFVAGEQLGRLVYGVEKEPVYCAVILQRLADMGLKPALIA